MCLTWENAKHTDAVYDYQEAKELLTWDEQRDSDSKPDFPASPNMIK